MDKIDSVMDELLKLRTKLDDNIDKLEKLPSNQNVSQPLCEFICTQCVPTVGRARVSPVLPKPCSFKGPDYREEASGGHYEDTR